MLFLPDMRIRYGLQQNIWCWLATLQSRRGKPEIRLKWSNWFFLVSEGSGSVLVEFHKSWQWTTFIVLTSRRSTQITNEEFKWHNSVAFSPFSLKTYFREYLFIYPRTWYIAPLGLNKNWVNLLLKKSSSCINSSNVWFSLLNFIT